MDFTKPKSFSNASKPQMCFRCVDDIFVELNSEKSVIIFFILLNSLHSSLQFTFEKECNIVLFLFLILCLRKMKVNKLLRLSRNRHLHVNNHDGTLCLTKQNISLINMNLVNIMVHRALIIYSNSKL